MAKATLFVRSEKLETITEFQPRAYFWKGALWRDNRNQNSARGRGSKSVAEKIRNRFRASSSTVNLLWVRAGPPVQTRITGGSEDPTHGRSKRTS